MNFRRVTRKQQRSCFSSQAVIFPQLVFGQRGFSLVELLVAAGVFTVLLFGLVQFQVAVNRNLEDTRQRFESIQWSREIVETLITDPICEASSPPLPPCTDLKTACTNTLFGFEDTAGNEQGLASIKSATTSLSPTATELFAAHTQAGGSANPAYDARKHTFSGLRIRRIEALGGFITDVSYPGYSAQTRDRKVVLRFWFESEGASASVRNVLLSRPLEVRVMIDEYQSDVVGHTDYHKVKTCRVVGSLGRDLEAIIKRVIGMCPHDRYFAGFDNFGNRVCRSFPIPDRLNVSCFPGSSSEECGVVILTSGFPECRCQHGGDD